MPRVVCVGDPACIWASTTAQAQDQTGWTTWTVLAMSCQSLTVHILAGVLNAVLGGVHMYQSSVPTVSRCVIVILGRST